MNLIEKIRNIAFWTIDLLKGGKIKSSLNLLYDIEEKQKLSEDEISEYHKYQIRSLLKHAVSTVPAYKQYAPSLDNVDPIKDWPVINKGDLKEGGDNYLSTKYKKENLIPMSTSGSTGTPFVCWQDPDKKRHVNAEVLFYNGKVNYKIGRRMIYFRSIVKQVAKTPLQEYLQNIFMINCQDLSDEGIREKLNKISKLSKKNGVLVLGYASTLDAFRKYFDKYGNEVASNCNVYGIVSGSEHLQDITRDSLSKAFNCKVISRYSNEENGFIGQDDEINNVFIPNRANYYIEILKFDSDAPADPGEIGRIVLTDLYNYAMPMIRYDTGDVGAWEFINVNGVKRQAIGKFGGRKVDMVFDSNGNAISPHTITNLMWDFTNINQFQFIQTGKKKYILKINTSEPVSENDLVSRYKEFLGENANISIEYCNEIPVLASGKRRYIVNQMPD